MLIGVGCLFASALPVAAEYAARLWFRNETKGIEGQGAVPAEPGDRVSIRFAYSTDDPVIERWTVLQATLSLDGLGMISDAEANTFEQQANAAFSPGTHFPLKVFWQPDYGPMYDNGIDPGDATKPFVAERGLYLVVGANGSTSSSWSFNRTIFTFTVQPEGVGQELHWLFDARETPAGLSTRMLDYQPVTVDVTDNFLVVVPGFSRVSGTVALEQWLPPAEGVEVEYWLLDGQQSVASGTTTLGPNGSYELSFPLSGEYRLRVKASHWLSALSQPLQLTPLAPAQADFHLVNGDADGDNMISLSDINAVLVKFALSNQTLEDLDGSGTVDLPDLSIALLGVGRVGD
ncbi:MAG: hypothetical protein AMXMBFR61_26970 [Fimbriimonadales bacterium]